MIPLIRKLLAAVLAASVLLVSCPGCQRDKPPAAPSLGTLTVLTIGTADSGGTMYPVGVALALALSNDTRKVNVSTSTGSSMNIQALTDGSVDLALVSGDAADAAYRVSGGTSSLRAVAAVYTTLSNWLAPESKDIKFVHDLKGLRLGMGPETSSTEQAALTVIDILGLNDPSTVLVNCGLSAGTELIPEETIDAIHGFAGIPISGFTTLANQIPCRVLRYTDVELDAILAANSIYVPATIPAYTYEGQDDYIPTFGVKCLLCVDASMDEELVYTITKTIWENRDTLSRAHPCMSEMVGTGYLFDELPVPLHPGAQRLYDEIC